MILERRQRTAIARGIADRDKNVARLYGLSVAQLTAMRQAQRNLCAICGEPETRTTSKGLLYALCVDHNHVTGQVRGLLCYRCNQLVAWLELASPTITAQAYKYLEHYT